MSHINDATFVISLVRKLLQGTERNFGNHRTNCARRSVLHEAMCAQRMRHHRLGSWIGQ